MFQPSQTARTVIAAGTNLEVAISSTARQAASPAVLLAQCDRAFGPDRAKHNSSVIEIKPSHSDRA